MDSILSDSLLFWIGAMVKGVLNIFGKYAGVTARDVEAIEAG